jgi:putative protease
MELLINPTSYDNAIDLIELGIHQINIGLREFSMRNNCILTFAQIKKIISNKKSTKIILLFNKIFFEQDIEDLEKMLVEVSKLDIDGIIFCDYAICQICFEKKLKVNLIYHPETLNVNYGQIPFFEKNGISEIVLARELNSLNIKDIAAHKGTIKIQIQVAGYSYMMQSR